MVTIPVIAQTTSGSISGTVIDASRASVPGAQVTAIDTQTRCFRHQLLLGGQRHPPIDDPVREGRLGEHVSDRVVGVGDPGEALPLAVRQIAGLCQPVERVVGVADRLIRRGDRRGTHRRTAETRN